MACLDDVFVLEDVFLAHFLRPVLHAGAPNKRVLELPDNAFVYSVAEVFDRAMRLGQHHRFVVIRQLSLLPSSPPSSAAPSSSRGLLLRYSCT